MRSQVTFSLFEPQDLQSLLLLVTVTFPTVPCLYKWLMVNDSDHKLLLSWWCAKRAQKFLDQHCDWLFIWRECVVTLTALLSVETMHEAWHVVEEVITGQGLLRETWKNCSWLKGNVMTNECWGTQTSQRGCSSSGDPAAVKKQNCYGEWFVFSHISRVCPFLYVAIPVCLNLPLWFTGSHRGVVKFTDLLSRSDLAQQLQIIVWLLIRLLWLKKSKTNQSFTLENRFFYISPNNDFNLMMLLEQSEFFFMDQFNIWHCAVRDRMSFPGVRVWNFHIEIPWFSFQMSSFTLRRIQM